MADANGRSPGTNGGGDGAADADGAGGAVPPAAKRRRHDDEGAVTAGGDPQRPSDSNDGMADELDDRKPAAQPAAAGYDGEGDNGLFPDSDGEGEGKPRSSAKRKRQDDDDNADDEDNQKSTGDNNNNNDNGGGLPLAPSLDAYLHPGGHDQYAPRPEWCAAPGDAVSVALRRGETDGANAGGGAGGRRGHHPGGDPGGHRAPLLPVGEAAAHALAVAEADANAQAVDRERMMDELAAEGRPWVRLINEAEAHAQAAGGEDGRVDIHEDGNDEDGSDGDHNNENGDGRAGGEVVENGGVGGEMMLPPDFDEAAIRREVDAVLGLPEGQHRGHHHRHNNHQQQQNEGEGRAGGIPLRQVIRVQNLDHQHQQGQRHQLQQQHRNEHQHGEGHPHRHHRHNHHRRHDHENDGQGEHGHGPGEEAAHAPHPPAAAAPAGGGRRELDHNPLPLDHDPLPHPDEMAAGANQNINNDVLPMLLQGQGPQPQPQQQPQPPQRRMGRLSARMRAQRPFGVLGDLAQPAAGVDAQNDPSNASTISTIPDHEPSTLTNSRAAVFGFECDSALHLAIKQRATDAALGLIKAGACVNFQNAKGITPLMVASQEGSLEIVRALLHKGALPNATTIRGSTALIQACHFGKLPVVDELLKHGAQVDQANLKNTTALMRASQEGHEDVVKLLLARNAGVNRRNDERMTALMLSSQRGHSTIVRRLVKAGAMVDAKTAQDSTSLMLACKRKHLDVAKILVASGTELKLKDCKHRTVWETATRRGNTDFANVLTDDAQVRLMQEDARRERNFEMVRTWRLFQSERATIRLGAGVDTTVRTVAENVDAPSLRSICPSKRALVRAMTLPAPLVELIASFVPLPLVWEKRLTLLTSRSIVDPDSAVYNALDLIDEVLEVGGVLQAFDKAGMDPPDSFDSWSAFQTWCGKCDVIMSRCPDMDMTNLLATDSDAGIDVADSDDETTLGVGLRSIQSSATQRRRCNYLQVLARAPQTLERILSSPPYDMSGVLLGKLRTNHDVQSVVRRNIGGGISFDTSFANELVVVARMAVMWCEARPMY